MKGEEMLKRILITFLLVVSLVGVVFLVYSQRASAKQDDESLKVLICHRDNDVLKPYEKISVNQNSTDGSGGGGDHFDEHKGPLAYSEAIAQSLKDDHIKWGDIIPPILGTDAADGLNWSQLGQAMWNNDCGYVNTIEVLAAVTFVDPTCDSDGSYTIPTTTGVTYYIGDQVVAAGVYPITSNTTVTVNAKANTGYFIDASTNSTWEHEFTVPTDEECVLGAESVVPAPVTFVDPSCDANGSYTIPATEGVEYKVEGVVTPAGTYSVVGNATINFTAIALEGFELEGTSAWSHQFTVPTDCVLGAQSVTPEPVIFTAPTCSLQGFYIIPETNGVDYTLDGKILTSGKYIVKNGETVVITAVAKSDFELKEGATNQWTYTSTAPVNCDGVGSVLGASTGAPGTLPLTSGDSTLSNLTVLSIVTTMFTGAWLAIRKVFAL